MKKMFLSLSLATFLLWGVSCTSANPAYCNSDADCHDPRFPVCDITIHGCVGGLGEAVRNDGSDASADDGGLSDGDEDSGQTDGADADGDSGSENYSDDDGAPGDHEGEPGDTGGDADGQGNTDSDRQYIYVDDDTCPAEGSGTAADPFCSIQDAVDQALDGDLPVLVLPGTYQEDLRINGSVSITGEGGQAVVESRSCPGILIMNRSTVILSHLEISGEGGVRVTASSHATISDNLIQETNCVGVDCQDSTCIVLRNMIRSNEQGGLNMSNSTYTVMNNIVVHNGQSGFFGGLQIRQAGAGSACAFNTLAFNQTSGMAPAGIACLTPTTIENSIVWENGDAGGEQITGNCTLNFSDVGPDQGAPGGSNNISADPRFVDKDNDDFHIEPDSPCVDRADPASPLTDDIDGQPRPQGLRSDIGADEAR